MKILIDIGHPAHVHLFKNFAWEMQKRGHKILFTCREKEFEIDLLNRYGFAYKSFGKKYNTPLGKIIGLFEFGVKELFQGLKFKPAIFLSHGSMYAAHAATLLRRPHISLEDTFNFEQIKLYLPFTKVVLTADYNHPSLGPKNIRYAGYHELAYLHPKYFKPNIQVLKKLGIENNEKYCILRFVSWKASHDLGHKGIPLEKKTEIVNRLSKLSKVFISSESQLPYNLRTYKFPLSPDKMHDALAFASLIFGESATMISEGAVLGVPGVYLDNTGRYYTTEQEKLYGLVFNFNESESDQQKAIVKAEEILCSNEQSILKQAHNKMLNEKINVTGFLVWFVQNYPESVKIMKVNPDYQFNFK